MLNHRKRLDKHIFIMIIVMLLLFLFCCSIHGDMIIMPVLRQCFCISRLPLSIVCWTIRYLFLSMMILIVNIPVFSKRTCGGHVNGWCITVDWCRRHRLHWKVVWCWVMGNRCWRYLKIKTYYIPHNIYIQRLFNCRFLHLSCYIIVTSARNGPWTNDSVPPELWRFSLEYGYGTLLKPWDGKM